MLSRLDDRRDDAGLQEHRFGDFAMMPLTLFAPRPFVGLPLLTLLLYGALGGLLVLLPYRLIVGGGIHTDQAGFALLPFSTLIATAFSLAGRLSKRIGSRWPPTIRPTVTGVGFAPMTTVDPRARFWGNVLPGLVVIALGMAGAVAPLTTAIRPILTPSYLLAMSR